MDAAKPYQIGVDKPILSMVEKETRVSISVQDSDTVYVKIVPLLLIKHFDLALSSRGHKTDPSEFY